MAKSDSPLVQAAAAFAEELAVYTRLGELFLKTPLSSVKHLERSEQTLMDLAACEQRLQAAGQTLSAALADAGRQQQQLSKGVVDHAPALQARKQQLAALMGTMGELASDAAGIMRMVSSDPQQEGQKPDLGEVAPRVLALSERAQQLAASATEAEFDELREQAHALHQRLKAVGEKLQKAGGN